MWGQAPAPTVTAKARKATGKAIGDQETPVTGPKAKKVRRGCFCVHKFASDVYAPFEQVIRKRRLPLQKAKAKKAADLFDDVFAFHSGSD